MTCFPSHQLGEEVRRLRDHAALHPKARNVLQIAGQLGRVSMDDYIDQDRQEIISTCRSREWEPQAPESRGSK